MIGKATNRILPVCLLWVAATAQARLREDDLQCMMRYGGASQRPAHESENQTSPLSQGSFARTKTYLYQGWKIRIGYVQNISHRMTYARDLAKPITEEQIQAILDANGGASAWNERIPRKSANLAEHMEGVFQSLGTRTWQRTDGSRATLRGHVLRLESAEAIRVSAEARAEQRRRDNRVPAF